MSSVFTLTDFTIFYYFIISHNSRQLPIFFLKEGNNDTYSRYNRNREEVKYLTYLAGYFKLVDRSADEYEWCFIHIQWSPRKRTERTDVTVDSGSARSRRTLHARDTKHVPQSAYDQYSILRPFGMPFLYVMVFSYLFFIYPFFYT